jgi:rare lipoprotein A (peptidoglycan hydrolase)
MHFPKTLNIFLHAFTALMIIILTFLLPVSTVLATTSATNLSGLSNQIPSPTPSPVPYSSEMEKLLSIIQTPQPIKKARALNGCLFTSDTWIGKASYYTWDGCLGCNEERQMANGEILDNNKTTLAFMRAPLNTIVEVKNLDTGASTVARVTDRGDFEPLGRIADVSEKVKDKIKLATDQSNIQITSLYCV